MKKILISLAIIVMFIYPASGEIIFSQPESVYNLGDTISITATIKSNEYAEDIFTPYLVCRGHSKEIVPKQYLEIQKGEEKNIDIVLKLNEFLIGEQKGNCEIKIVFDEKSFYSEDFLISDKLEAELEESKNEFKPGEKVIINGNVLRETGDLSEGFVSLEIPELDMTPKSTINNGKFSLEFTIPYDAEANSYYSKIEVYEKDTKGNPTNKGFVNYGLKVLQVPKNLEIVLENQLVEPKTSLRVKTLLHDQTGKNIEEKVIITIKDNRGKIMLEEERLTDEFLEFPIEQKTPPRTWSVLAVFKDMNAQTNFDIKEKKEIKPLIVNKTLVLENTGNVLYNDSFNIKIGEENLEVYLILDVGNTKKFILTAPDGEYGVEVMGIKQSVALTGNAIGIKDATNKISSFKNIVIWVFIIVVLGFVTFVFFKKTHNKSFFGYVVSKKKEIKEIKDLEKKDVLISPKQKAELSLSIQGQKQSVSLLCLSLKNFHELKKTKENCIKDTLRKIISLAQEKKAYIYDNKDSLFFIFAPLITKTFDNEKSSVKLGIKIREILRKHNSLFKHEIIFGISINSGEIVAKKKGNNLEFMGIGSIIPFAKKLAGFSRGEILYNEYVDNKLYNYADSKKVRRHDLEIFELEGLKHTKEHEKFIKDFIKRMEFKK
jgi:hypothetical protein